MGRPAAAQVDLERVWTPTVVAPHRDEVDARAPDHAFAGQPAPDLQPFGGNALGVLVVGWKVTAEVRLAVRAPQHLVVRRHDVDLPRRAHTKLDAGAAEHLAIDSLLDDPAFGVQSGEILVDALLRILELERAARVVGRVELDERFSKSAHPA